MFLNLIKGWYFLIDGKVIWNILQFTNKFWKVTTKFFRSNWINKTCWTEVFFKIIKDFLRGHFPGVGFKVDSCFLAWEKSLSSSLLIADWLILVASGLKYLFFLKCKMQPDSFSSLWQFIRVGTLSNLLIFQITQLFLALVMLLQ